MAYVNFSNENLTQNIAQGTSTYESITKNSQSILFQRLSPKKHLKERKKKKNISKGLFVLF